jgi:hypothetical protein
VPTNGSVPAGKNNHQRGGEAVEKEIVPLENIADARGDHDAPERLPVEPRCHCLVNYRNGHVLPLVARYTQFHMQSHIIFTVNPRIRNDRARSGLIGIGLRQKLLQKTR